MPANGKSRQQRRSHVTTACTNCRHSKLKCDGQKPSCGACSNKKQECEYQLGKDKRQFSLRKVTDVYSKRVIQLEQFIQALGAEVPPPTNQTDASVLKQIGESISLPSSSVSAPDLVVGETQGTSGSVTAAGQVDDGNHLYGLPSNYFPGPNVVATDECDINQALEASPGSGLSYEAYDFMMPGHTFQPGIDIDSVDWAWSMPHMTSFIPIQPDDAVDVKEATQNQFTDISNFQSWIPTSSQANVVAQNVQESTEHSGPSSEEEHDEEIVEQLSTRLGDLFIGDMGELRYYGPTSNLTLTAGGIPHEHRPSVTNRPKETYTKLEQDGVGHDVDTNLTDQLIDLYFTWQDPSCHIVDKIIFHEERSLCRGSDRESSLYSAALENVICALGALFYGDKHPDLPRPLSKFFARRARILVEYELDCPKVATVQTFALLSWHEATCTRDSRGWLYAGAAIRISLDLGLHIDTTTRVEDGSMSFRAAYARSVAFWGSFLTDRMWGFYLGRPFNLQLSEISLNLPSPKESEDAHHVWTPSGMFDEKDDDKPPILDCSRDMLSLQWVTLCQISSSLTVPLYGREAVSKEELVDLGVEAFRRLREWKSNLPSQLQYDPKDKSTKVTPHVLLLHMQYYVFLIIQHRPFISKSSIQPYPPRGDGPLHARRVCLESAIEIARLLDDYATRFAFRLANTQIVHMAFSAALILLFASVSETDRHRHATLAGHLATCCDALAELGKVFENATRSLDTLLIIKRTWQAGLVSGAGRKRRSNQHTDSIARTLRQKIREVKIKGTNTLTRC